MYAFLSVSAVKNIPSLIIYFTFSSELESKQISAKDEKRRLRTLLRKFEAEFQNATGRPPQKDEKYSSVEMESIYQKYKRCRATVRLLDVLITKRKYPQLLVDINKIED